MLLKVLSTEHCLQCHCIASSVTILCTIKDIKVLMCTMWAMFDL